MHSPDRTNVSAVLFRTLTSLSTFMLVACGSFTYMGTHTHTRYPLLTHPYPCVYFGWVSHPTNGYVGGYCTQTIKIKCSDKALYVGRASAQSAVSITLYNPRANLVDCNRPICCATRCYYTNYRVQCQTWWIWMSMTYPMPNWIGT